MGICRITWSTGIISYLHLSSSGSNVFYWFTNITTVGGFISWVLVGVAYLVCSYFPDYNPEDIAKDREYNP
jgi:amino acid permease